MTPNGSSIFRHPVERQAGHGACQLRAERRGGPVSQILIATTIGILTTVSALVIRGAQLGRRLSHRLPAEFRRLSQDNRLKDFQLLAHSVQVKPHAEAITPEKHTYSQILHSSALIGASSVLNIAIGIVGTKAMAVLLGPAGFGLMAMYNSIADFAQNIASMGINSSGVRQIAAAVGSSDEDRIARTAAVLRRTSLILGVLGAILLIGFSGPVSTFTFGSPQHATAVALLSAAVFFRCVSAGQGALIQGVRRMRDLAKMSVLGALFGTVISIPVVYFLREDGVVPSLVAVSTMTIVTSWWYSRKVKMKTQSMTMSQLGGEAATLLKLGFAFMASGLMMSGATYVVRVLVLREVGFEAAGLYQSAWTLGGLYVGFILNAMAMDFYPRLTAVAEDNTACNRLVNEQAQVGLLMATAGVIATLTFSPLVITLFYSPKFYEAAELLRWLCLGMTLRIISWPMGFIILAKGAQKLFFWSELAWTATYLGLSLLCVISFGLNGAGVAFFGSYVFHALLSYLIARRLSGFGWSTANKRISLLLVSLIGAVFVGFYILPPLLATAFGILAVIFSGVYSVRALFNLVGRDRIPRSLRQLISRFR
jgi:antigen flippase